MRRVKERERDVHTFLMIYHIAIDGVLAMDLRENIFARIYYMNMKFILTELQLQLRLNSTRK